jgi:trehalose/maltose transport system substrate-binding protein
MEGRPRDAGGPGSRSSRRAGKPFSAPGSVRFGRAAVVALLLVALAAACGGPRRETGDALRFVTWKPNVPGVWDEAVRRFERANPGVRVVREVGPHSTTAFHDLLTQKLKNRDPDVDVFLMDVVWPAEFAAAGWAQNVAGRLSAEDRAAFLPATLAANTWRGGIYGIPAFIDAGLLYYRKDLLDAYRLSVPATWEELARTARQIVAGERRKGRKIAGYSGQFKQYEGLVCDMLEFVASNGGRLIDPASGRAALSSPAVLEAVRWVRDSLIGEVAPRSVLTYEEPESLSLFIQGKAVFLRNWPYAWGLANDPRRSRVVGEVGVTSLPHFPGHASASTLGGWQYGISAFSRRPELAWRFVAFMSSPEMQRFLAVHAFRAPARAALYRDRAVLAANPQFAGQAAAFGAALPRPVTPVYPAISSVLQRFFSQALAARDSDIAALAQQADREIDGYLEMVSSQR